MTDEERELNLKLVKWVGLPDARFDGIGWLIWWLETLKGYTGCEPFTESMDSFLKYVEPQLLSKGFEIWLDNRRGYWTCYLCIKGQVYLSTQGNKLPFVLCRAVEKLIQYEVV